MIEKVVMWFFLVVFIVCVLALMYAKFADWYNARIDRKKKEKELRWLHKMADLEDGYFIGCGIPSEEFYKEVEERRKQNEVQSSLRSGDRRKV